MKKKIANSTVNFFFVEMMKYNKVTTCGEGKLCHRIYADAVAFTWSDSMIHFLLFSANRAISIPKKIDPAQDTFINVLSKELMICKPRKTFSNLRNEEKALMELQNNVDTTIKPADKGGGGGGGGYL